MKKPKKLYTEADLVSFGKYLLSFERKESIVWTTANVLDLNERLKDVYHSDLENWKVKSINFQK